MVHDNALPLHNVATFLDIGIRTRRNNRLVLWLWLEFYVAVFKIAISLDTLAELSDKGVVLRVILVIDFTTWRRDSG